MFKQILLASIGTMMFHSPANADSKLVCSQTNPTTHGFSAITLDEKANGETYITGSVSGGIAQFVTGFGPILAEKTVEGDAVTYSFQDQAGQENQVTILTSVVAGHRFTTLFTSMPLYQGHLPCK